MKSKIFGSMIASVLVLVLCLGAISATITFSNVPTLSTTGNSYSVTVTSDRNETVSFVTPATITQSSKTITFNPISNVVVTNAPNPQVITGTYTVDSNFDFLLGKTYSTTLTASNATHNYSQALSFAVNNNVCKYTDRGNLDIDLRSVDVVSGFGNDEEWLPMDEVEVEVKVENNGNEKIKDIVLAWGLYDKDTQKWIIDDEESDFDLKDGDDNIVTIKFKLDDVSEFENNGDYVFYVWATGDDYEFDGNTTCISDSANIDMIIESDFVVLDDIEALETTSCDSEVQITADAWNIGDNDQDEVFVRITNKELGIEKDFIVGDIKAFDNEKLTATINIPKDAAEKIYVISLTVYDESDDIYVNDYDDDEAVFQIPLKVEGNCGATSASTNDATIVTAKLVSGGEAGKDLVVEATFINKATKPVTYILSATGYEDWANSVDMADRTFTLNAGESKTTSYTFDVKDDASGENAFYIEAFSGTELAVKQPVSVTIAKSNASVSNLFGDNWYLWAVGIVNLILVIIIIVVAVRVARK